MIISSEKSDVPVAVAEEDCENSMLNKKLITALLHMIMC